MSCVLLTDNKNDLAPAECNDTRGLLREVLTPFWRTHSCHIERETSSTMMASAEIFEAAD
jgi:hypothetical protein